MIVAVVSEKGGCGKTTIAVHLAAWRASGQQSVMLLDADTQGSASLWMVAREATGLPAPASVRQYGRGFYRSLQDLSRHYDDIIVDIGSGSGEIIEAVLHTAHMVVVPVEPSGLNMWSLSLMERLTRDASNVNRTLQVFSVINRAAAHPSSLDVKASQEKLEEFDAVQHSGLVIRERTSIRRAVPAGLLVDEYRPKDQKGTSELRQIYSLAFGN